MSPTHVIVPSPIGPLTIMARGGAVTHVLMDAAKYRPTQDEVFGVAGDPSTQPFATAAAQLAEYFAGERPAFDVPLAPSGEDFQQRVWALLRTIPYGRTRTYGEIAISLGGRHLAQAVGAANGHNPIAVIVPCHRVIGSDGSLVGYAGGLARKRYLLSLEEAPADQAGRLF